ncbi:hypothetical protein E8E15_004635 [Penicillium rubens]|jgi:hypothetical protein|nr:hypothetical protein E8E15_004635 [Penicillium rubens]
MSSIYDFDRQKESDISKIVPKLKGEPNFAQWQHRLYMALKENNKNIEIIQGIAQKPVSPELYDESVETIRELAQHRAFASGSDTPVSDTLVRELVKEQKQKNKELLKGYQVLVGKWDLINTRCYNLIFSTLDTIPASHVQNVENAREAFKLLRAEYGSSSWQGNFKRFEVLINLQYKNNPQEFVRRFKEALFEIQQRNPVIPADMVLNFFVKAVQGNPRCQAFIQNLDPDLKGPNFMVGVYHDFTMIEGSNRIAHHPGTFNHSANITSSAKDSAASNSPRKDDDKSTNDNSPSSDKKKKKKKQKPVYEKDAIWCKIHNSLGNHFTRNCHLKKGGGSTNAVHQQLPFHQQQPASQQLPFQPGQIIDQVDSQGRVILNPQQQRSRTNTVYAPPPPPPPTGDTMLRYNNLFTKVLFHSDRTDTQGEWGVHVVPKEGLMADNGGDTATWKDDPDTSTLTPHHSVFEEPVFGPIRTEVQTTPVRFGAPPPPTVEDADDTDLFAPACPPLDSSDPAILRELPNRGISTLSAVEDRLPDPDSFEIDSDNDEMAGRIGTIVEEQKISPAPRESSRWLRAFQNAKNAKNS